MLRGRAKHSTPFAWARWLCPWVRRSQLNSSNPLGKGSFFSNDSRNLLIGRLPRFQRADAFFGFQGLGVEEMRANFWFVVFGVVACSDYNFIAEESSQTAPNPGLGEDWGGPLVDTSIEEVLEEECNGIDDDGDGEVDEGFDANGNGIPDCTEEEGYCTAFDDFADWSYVGDGNWHIENGVLTEGRGGFYDAVAWTADVGSSSRFYMEVDVAWEGSLNDLAGLAWAVDQNRYFAVRWDDPQGDYDRYIPPGGLDLVWCEDGECEVLASDVSKDLTRPATKVFSKFAVAVDGQEVSVIIDGLTALQASVPEILGSGPGVVGLYSNDNDGGVWFDNFCVWVDAA